MTLTNTSSARARSSVPDDQTDALSSHVEDWLARRCAQNESETTVCLRVMPGRWLLRIESGESASSIDQPVHGEHSLSDVVAEVRRWARAAGHTARVEPVSAGEARVAIVLAVPVGS
jgi:hypothetical protein